MNVYVVTAEDHVLVTMFAEADGVSGEITYELHAGEQLWGWMYEDFKKMGNGHHKLTMPKPQEVVSE